VPPSLSRESVSMMDHEQTMGVNSRVLDQKQLNIFGHISLFWSVELQGHPEQLNEGDHDWLIQTPVSTVQRGMLVQPDADTCTPRHTLCIQFSAERAANVIASNVSGNVIKLSLTQYDLSCGVEHVL